MAHILLVNRKGPVYICMFVHVCFFIVFFFRIMLLDFEGQNVYSTSLKVQVCVDEGEPCYINEVILDRVNIPKSACYFGPDTYFIVNGKYNILIIMNLTVRKCILRHESNEHSGSEIIKLFSCSTQLSMKFVWLINLKLLIIKITWVYGSN